MAAVTSKKKGLSISDRTGTRSIRVSLVVHVVLLILISGVAFLLLRQNVAVSDIVLSEETPIFEQSLLVTANLHNNGRIRTQYPAILQLDGQDFDVQPITIKSQEPASLSFDISNLAPGPHTLSIDRQTIEFVVYRPADLKLTELTMQPELVFTGEPSLVRVGITNSGDLDGYFSDTLWFNDRPLESIECTVPPGQTVVLEVPLIIQERGQHTLSINQLESQVQVLAPAMFTVSNLTLSSLFAKPEEPVAATILVQNQGDFPGKYIAELCINGQTKQTRGFQLAAGESSQATFEILLEEPGHYEIQAGSYSKILQVVTIKRPENGAILVRDINSGYGRLTLKNLDPDNDSIIVLASPDEPDTSLLAVYVRAGQTSSNIRVKDGTYLVYCTYGKEYDAASGRFFVQPSYNQFEETISFKTATSATVIDYVVWTVSVLDEDGNALAAPVQDTDFPR